MFETLWLLLGAASGAVSGVKNRKGPESFRNRSPDPPVHRNVRNRILLVEDDPSLASVLTDSLSLEGFDVESMADGISARERAFSRSYDLVLLDVQLPGCSGYEVCHSLRDQGVTTPILMLTGRTAVSDRVEGFRSGADDYVLKPFDMQELLARIGALLKRANTQRLVELRSYRFGDVDVEFTRGRASKGGSRVNLAAKELQLLRYLISRKDRVVSRDELLREVWGYGPVVSRTVDVHIASLRQKIEDDPQHPRHVVTVRGEGYVFRD